MGDARGHPPRPALPPQRPAGPRRRPARRPGYARAEVLRRLRFAKPASSFRSQYAYTNFGYTEAAVAAARAAGKAWEDLAAEKLYRPLGMKSSSFRFADYAAAKNRAHLHVRVDGKWVAKYVREPDAQSPAGGASSTARDLAQWLRLQLGGGKFDGKQLIAATALARDAPAPDRQPPAGEPVDRPGRLLRAGLERQLRRPRPGPAEPLRRRSTWARRRWSPCCRPRTSASSSSPTGRRSGVPEAISASFFDLVLKGKVEKDWLELFRPIRHPGPGHLHSPADYGVTLGCSFGTKPKETNSAWPSSPRRKSANFLAAAEFSVRETMPRYCTTGS